MKWVGGSCEVTAVIATLELEALSSETLLLAAATYSLFLKCFSQRKNSQSNKISNVIELGSN